MKQNLLQTAFTLVEEKAKSKEVFFRSELMTELLIEARSLYAWSSINSTLDHALIIAVKQGRIKRISRGIYVNAKNN